MSGRPRKPHTVRHSGRPGLKTWVGSTWSAVKNTNGATFEDTTFVELFAALRREPSTCPHMALDIDPNTHQRFRVMCMRSTSHQGRHIATGHAGIIAAWPGNELPTMKDLTD